MQNQLMEGQNPLMEERRQFLTGEGFGPITGNGRTEPEI
jgi:hypothetical protein